MFRTVSKLPFFKLLAIVQVALLARRHLGLLTRDERHRLYDLARHGRTLTPAERAELRNLAMKLEPGAFAMRAADRVSPVPLPGRRARRRR
jgi:hypothetical protein